MNCILISCVCSVVISVFFAVISHGTSGAMDGIKLTDWMQGLGSITAVIIACFAAKWANDAAKNSDKISIGQNVNDIAKFFSEKINDECPKTSEMKCLDNGQEGKISAFITSVVKAKEAIENISVEGNRHQYFRILMVYLTTDVILELRDGTCFLEALNYYINKNEENFYTNSGKYEIWCEIYKQYQDIQQIFGISVSPDYLRESEEKLNKHDMLEKLDNEKKKRLKQEMAECLSVSKRNPSA